MAALAIVMKLHQLEALVLLMKGELLRVGRGNCLITLRGRAEGREECAVGCENSGTTIGILSTVSRFESNIRKSASHRTDVLLNRFDPTHHSVVSGTGRFDNASGRVRLSGAVEMANFPDSIGFNCIFVIDLDK